MSVAAILGAGPLAGAIAHKLAERAAFRRVLLVDDAEAVATGLALDIRQSGPIAGFDVDLSASAETLAAAGADVIILADRAGGGDWEGDGGLALVGRLMRAGTKAPFVLAGATPVSLMERAARELKVPADRLIGSAASGLVSAVRALVGLELDLAGAAVDVAIAGRPPAFVVGWSTATVAGALVTERVPAHRLAAIGQAMPRLWPPGPRVCAAATSLIAEALVHGSRTLHYAMTVLDGDLGAPGVAAMLPLELGQGRVLRRSRPSFSPLEQTALLTGITRG
jgi:malate dehydrogenase